MRSVIDTYLFIGGPADGTKVMVRNPEQPKVEVIGRPGEFTSRDVPDLGRPWSEDAGQVYERTVINTQHAVYVIWKLEGMLMADVIRRLLTRYHGG